MKASRTVREIAMCEDTRDTRMTAEVTDDLYCSCQRATQASRQRLGAKLSQKSDTFCQDKVDESQTFKSLQPTLSVCHYDQLWSTTCKCSLPHQCQRTHSVSACPSRSVLRIPSSSSARTTTHISSVLLHQLRLISFLILLSVSLFQQIDIATARAMGHPQQQGQDDDTLPARCTRAFSNYDCGSLLVARYTFRNGSCQSALEWIGGPDCEYDGMENSFTSEQECMDVCIPGPPTTTEAPSTTPPPINHPCQNGAESSTATSVPQQAESSTDDDIATDVTESPTVNTTICFLPVEERCSMITFPVSYFYYNLDSLSCVPRVSFCTISGPNIFDSMEDCLNTCERPLTTTTTTEAPPTTQTTPPLTTTDCPPTTTDDVITQTTTQAEHRTTTVVPDPMTTTPEEDTPTTTESLPTTKFSSPTTTNDEPLTAVSSSTTGSSAAGVRPSFIELNRFDLASVGLGTMAFLLMVILVGVVMLSLYRRHVRLRRQTQEVMDTKKSEVRTLAFTASHHEKPVVQTKQYSNTSTSTTSSTVSSYLTTV